MNNHEAAFPFVRNKQDNPDAFIIKTNDPTENPHEIDPVELRRNLLYGKMDNYEEKYIEAFFSDENFNPFIDMSLKLKKEAEDYLQFKVTEYPDRYFILKKVAQNPEFWEICLHKNIVLVNEEIFISKLQNQTEISNNVFLFFMSVELKMFLGYAKVVSDVKPIQAFSEIDQYFISSDIDISSLKAFKIQWIATNPVNFDDVKFIRNYYNENQQINMCKEFQEVHIFAAFLLLDIMINPEKAISHEINPFNPVSQADNLTQSIYYIYNAIQDRFKENQKFQEQQDEEVKKQKKEYDDSRQGDSGKYDNDYRGYDRRQRDRYDYEQKRDLDRDKKRVKEEYRDRTYDNREIKDDQRKEYKKRDTYDNIRDYSEPQENRRKDDCERDERRNERRIDNRRRDDRVRDERVKDDRDRNDRDRDDRVRDDRRRDDRGKEDRRRDDQGSEDRRRDDILRDNRGRESRGRDERKRDDRNDRNREEREYNRRREERNDRNENQDQGDYKKEVRETEKRNKKISKQNTKEPQWDQFSD